MLAAFPGSRATDPRAAEEQTQGPLTRLIHGGVRSTMKAGGKSARTSPDEEASVAPSVAKLPIDPNGGVGKLRALGGGKHDEWNQHLTAQLAGALPEAFDDGGDRGGFARRFDWPDRYRSPGPGGRHAERPNDRGECRRA